MCPSEPSKVLLGHLANFIAVLIQLSGRSIWTYMAIWVIRSSSGLGASSTANCEVRVRPNRAPSIQTLDLSGFAGSRLSANLITVKVGHRVLAKPTNNRSYGKQNSGVHGLPLTPHGQDYRVVTLMCNVFSNLVGS